ncbi:hypothetical protein [Mesorhizobium sp.]|uniref:hypothetical protein n=1 Tax=Mesorhizobium sp. TaxID=1871066 RepID=UPI0025BD9A2C|nr:hypothetical protein [Mesorhizobium sp.]
MSGQVATDQHEFGADDPRQREHQQMVDDGEHEVGGVHARFPRIGGTGRLKIWAAESARVENNTAAQKSQSAARMS